MKTFKFKNDLAKHTLLENRIMEDWVKKNLGYRYYNNDYQEIINSDELELSNTTLFDEVINNPKNFYLDVLQNINGFESNIYVYYNKRFILCRDGSILERDSDLVGKIYLATGFFSDIQENNNINLSQKTNDFIKQGWDMNFDLNISNY